MTNGDPDTQEPNLASLGIADHFETVVLAGFDTASEPDPEPFERARRARHRARGGGLGPAVADGPPSDAEYVVDALTELVSPPWA